ncbi:MAG: SidA/IucD/PvdA family monooxygenase [Actinobacteria bacterium]|nr:SidA/IucD/PvdA family monooxygenase [Actinomycetota bacterium]
MGAGPQALTLLSYIAEHQPGLLSRTVVFDPDDWLARWHRQFATYRIPMLRSGCVHHPHPDPYALIRFARERGRSEEFRGSIGRPDTRLFADFCGHLIGEYGLGALRVAERVRDLHPLTGGGAHLVTRAGTWRATRVVLASNPVRPVTPTWLGDARARYPGEAGLVHSGQWVEGMADGADAVVVGGGLTAAQIVANQAAAGGHVTWLTRARLRERDLDVEAPWLGSELRRFHAARDAGARLAMAQRARGGGSIPADDLEMLRPLLADGRVTHLQGAVDRVKRTETRWRVSLRHQGTTRVTEAAHVVCATGSRAHTRSESLLRRCRAQVPVRRVRGMPVLDRDLAWPGTSVHLMGPLAVVGLGPACRTIIGARIAAERLLHAWGVDDAPQQYPWPGGELGS